MEKRQRWHSRIAFIMAAVGSAVGLGNVWRFPYIAYKNGGGAFFIPYFVALISAGIPVMILEYSLGILYQRGAPGAIEKISKKFKWVGWFALLVGLSISFYYVPVMGWAWHYMVESPDYGWAQPTQKGTVFVVPYATYDSASEKERVRNRLRKDKKNVRLVKKGDIDSLKKRLTNLWDGEDIVFWEDPEKAKSFIRTIEQEGGAGDPPQEIHALLIPHQFLDSDSPEENIYAWAGTFFEEQLQEERKSQNNPWLIRLDPDRRTELVRIKENATKYWSRKTLGGFAPGQWKKENLLGKSIKLLESEDFRTEDMDPRYFTKRIQLRRDASGLTTQDYVDAKMMSVSISQDLIDAVQEGEKGWQEKVTGLLNSFGTYLARFDSNQNETIDENEREKVAAFLTNARQSGVIEINFLETLAPVSARVFSAFRDAEENMLNAETDAREKEFRQEMGRHRTELFNNLKGIQARQEEQNGGETFTSRMFTWNWELVGWSILTWIIIFLIVFKGVDVVGKVVMLTVPIPLILLGILIIRGILMDGAMDGLQLYLDPSWHKVAKPDVWLAAFGQVFFTLSLGFGIMIAYASYQPEDSDITNNSFITSFANCGTSFYAGFAVFSVLGALAWTLNTPVEEVVTAGPGLVFNVYPVALMEMDGGWILGLMFFFSLLTLGIDSAFSIVEAVITGLNDTFKETPRILIVSFVCGAGVLASLLFCMNSGLMWLDIADNFVSSSFGLPLVGFLECLAVGLFFDTEELREKINKQSEVHLGYWWNVLIQIVIPAGLLFLLWQGVVKEAPGTYGGYHKVLTNSVYLVGWGYFAFLLFLSFVIAGSTVGSAWIASGVVLGAILMPAMETAKMALMTTVGIMLLLGGLITCLYYSKKAREEKLSLSDPEDIPVEEDDEEDDTQDKTPEDFMNNGEEEIDEEDV